MSDRTVCCVWCRSKDRRWFEDRGWDEKHETRGEAVYLIDHQAYCGNVSELNLAHEEGRDFLADSSADGEIPAMVYASLGGVFVECLAIEELPIARLDDEGRPNADDVRDAQTYHRLRREFERLYMGK